MKLTMVALFALIYTALSLASLVLIAIALNEKLPGFVWLASVALLFCSFLGGVYTQAWYGEKFPVRTKIVQ